MLVAVLSFIPAAILVTLLPGPDTLIIVRGIVRGGRRGGLRTSAGVLCGLVVWVAAAALGLSLLLRASEIGYNLLKVAGAVYLVWVGVQSLRSLLQPTAPEAPDEPKSLFGRSFFLAGLLTDILNPKVGVFFVSFLPAFVPAGHSVGSMSLLLGAIFVVLTAIYCGTLVAASGTVSNWMQTPRIRRRLDAVTGCVLIGFGVRLATES